MDKLQFLDLTDLSPGEEESLANLLYNVDYSEAVEFPSETPPPTYDTVHQMAVHQLGSYPEMPTVVEIPASCCTATWIPAAYPSGEPQAVGVQEQVEGESAGWDAGHIVPPHSVHYTHQMIPTPSVYVSNMTANVNVQAVGFIPQQPLAYPSVPFIPSVETTRKPRPTKTPTKRSPEVRRSLESPQTNYSPTFNQLPNPPTPTIPPSIPTPLAFQYFYTMPPMPRPFVYPATAPVYNGYPPQVPQVFPSPCHMPESPSHPNLQEENAVPYLEQDQKVEPQQPVYQQQTAEQEETPVVDTVIVENSNLQQTVEEIEPTDEVQVEENKVEKPLTTTAQPPANAFKSVSSLTQKPPFPQSTSRHKRSSIDNGPEFVEPPEITGPPKKSYASLFGAGDRNSSPIAQSDSAVSKPLAMIHPTVHNNVSNVPSPTQNCVNKPSTPAAQEYLPTTPFSSNSVKVRPEKMILPDYDINMQRLGEFLTSYQLDHKPLLLQPRGLTNRSNYCYINAILQALVACPPFYNLMKAIPPSQENKGSKSRTPIIDSMVKFVNEFSLMSLNTRPVGRKEKAQATKEGGASEVVTGPAFEPAYVYKMLTAMHAAFPVEGRQEDAEEFLSCLLNGLNDEMLEAMKLIEPQTNGMTNGEVTTNGDHNSTELDHEWSEVVSKNKSVVTRRAEFGRTPLSAIFRGQMRSRVTRDNVEKGTTDNVQPFFTLQLDIEKAKTLENALEQLVDKDVVVGGVCPKTKQEISMSTQTTLEELPIILLLHLKCFDYKLHTCSKIMKTIEYNDNLRIDLKLLSSKTKTTAKDRQYKLLAVVYHDGKEATKGHYMTDVFHMGYSGWLRYDDASVRPVTLQQVLNPKSPRMPYLLYYRRCDTIGTSVQDKNR